MTTALAPIVFRAICAWCSRVEREGTPNAPVSHTICPKCTEGLYFSSTTIILRPERSTQVG